MDAARASAESAAQRSRAATVALAAVGLVVLGDREVRRAARAGQRATEARLSSWGSRLLPPARDLVAEGRRREQRWRGEIAQTVSERLTDGVTRALVQNAVIERAASQLLAAGTLERVADQVAASPLPAHVVDEVLSDSVVEPVAARLIESPELDRVLDRILESPALDELVAKLLESPATDRLVADALESPGLERLIVRVLESRLVDELTDRVLASEELQRVITHIAGSPAVRTAITENSAGLANELADQVRSRTVVADDRVERAARRLVRRRPIDRPGPSELGAPFGPDPG